MTTLSNIFIEIDLDFTEQDKVYGKGYLEDLVRRQSQLCYRQEDVDVNVHLEHGSLKIYIKVAASLYLAIGVYGSFRSGLDYLKKDTQAIYETVTKDLKKNGLSKDLIKKKKIDSGVVDKLKRLIVRLEKIEKSDLKDYKTLREIENIQKYTAKIINSLDEQSDIDFIVAKLYEADKKCLVYGNREPEPLPRLAPTNIFMRNEEEDQKFLGNLRDSDTLLSHYSGKFNEVKKMDLDE